MDPRDDGHTTLPEVAALVESWDRSLDGARPLRTLLRSLPKGGRPGNATERALLIARSAVGGTEPGSLLPRIQAHPELAGPLGPFLGAPELGRWPFDDPFSLPDEEAVGWLPILAAHAAIDERIRRFVLVFFVARRRSVWLPAARALGRMAARDEVLRATLAQQWEGHFPKGLPACWPAEGLLPAEAPAAAGSAERRKDAVHTARHLLTAAATHVAEAGEAPLAGFSVQALTSASLSRLGGADASAVLHGLDALLDGQTARPVVLASLPKRAAEAVADEQVDDVLRSIVLRLGASGDATTTVEAVEGRLARPLWKKAARAKRLDLLWSWLDTAIWFSGRGKTERVAAMQQDAGEASQVLAWRLGEAPRNGPLDELLLRLPVLFDPDVFATTEDATRTARTAEILELLRHPELRALPWPSVVARAGGREAARAATPGNAEHAGPLDVALLLATHEEAPSVLLRDAMLPEEAVVRLARCTNGFVTRQVAVQLERLLREADDDDHRVGLLWRVLASDPPAETFTEIVTILRRLPPFFAVGDGRQETPIADLVRAAGVANALCESMSGPESTREERAALRSATLALVRATRESVVTAAGPRVAEWQGALDTLADSLERLPWPFGDTTVGSREWLEGTAGLLGPIETGGAVATWGRCLGQADRELTSGWSGLEKAVADLAGTPGHASPEQARAVQEAVETMETGLRPAARPLRRIGRELLLAAASWKDDCVERSRRNEAIRAEVVSLLDSGDESALCTLVNEGSAKLEALSAQELQRVHRQLLASMRLREAHRFWERFSGKTQLAPVWSHLSPLLLGAAGGAFLVLDVGTAWNEVLLAGHEGAFAATAALTLACSWLLLATGVASAMGQSPGSRRGRLRTLFAAAWRALPVFLGSLALSVGISAVVLLTLADTSTRVLDGHSLPLAPQIVLWGALSQFLGLFIGLILQGRGFTNES